MGSVKPSSSLQPDLGAQWGKGQVLAVLHHRHGRRHEHLEREEPGVCPEGPQDHVTCEECAALGPAAEAGRGG